MYGAKTLGCAMRIIDAAVAAYPGKVTTAEV
jgi:hypothetical protein